jgi:SnoaL-like domain
VAGDRRDSSPERSGSDLAAQVASLGRRVDDLEAVLAIHRLKARYGELVDRRYAMGALVPAAQLRSVVDEVVGLFTDDARWDGGPVLGAATGRRAIAERLANPTLVFSRHLFVKPRIEVDGDRAAGRWDLLCPCKTPDGRSWWVVGVEEDDYRREADGVWRHERMSLTTVCSSPADGAFDRILA